MIKDAKKKGKLSTTLVLKSLWVQFRKSDVDVTEIRDGTMVLVWRHFGQDSIHGNRNLRFIAALVLIVGLFSVLVALLAMYFS
jgi:hypothetical protein